MEKILESILECNETIINPTIIYNEGWMIILLVTHSIKENIEICGIKFGKLDKWTSEALISSPFTEAPKLREGYTHVDVAIGDFNIDYIKAGKLKLKDSKMFGVIEAKMNSNLSKGTTNFKNYNQATRNVTCIAKNILDLDCQAYFIVAAPREMIKTHKIDKQIHKDNIMDELNNRFSVYDESFKKEQRMDELKNKINEMNIISISYEEWIEKFSGLEIYRKLELFYSKCKTWNRLSF